ncbi:hypothetical protein HU147_17295 [Planomicrobium chinense]|uniref:Uncharacterized protein n=2 Tax=Planococcus TaxID=1372 RepID=A0A7H8Q905_9BACL|nr:MULTISPECIES: hypothetical protein [Planococcus]MCP2033823.1 hypothetical protein [Planomicrobium sp. HSC-17F08]ETP69063.1 hypothetical protein G159_09145 [Planococcus glaciei CHR43]KOF12204.1 hypothetical protein AC739_01455 [Planococcus glaciei]MBX0314351.1 hypothetical protein [Planococcus glaciei]MBZ5202958.1 hypothetical protein [Planococcus chinensis]
MTDKKPFNEENRETRDTPSRDNPEQVKTDKETMHEMFKEEETVDAIPLEDLKENMDDEENKRSTKDSSGSDKLFPD